MSLEPPGLPMRFPCWCRAKYSWGGESKRDLGFIEGDLIECLNAGDGSWWMGRLRRDKRMMGLFPSNFVEVLDDSFQPASRASSQVSQISNRVDSPNAFNAQQPKDNKPKLFRKAFSAYAAPDEAAKQREESRRIRELAAAMAAAQTQSQSSKSIHDNVRDVPSPKAINGYGSRAPSPMPANDHRPHSRGPSPAPPAMNNHYSRAASPAPTGNHYPQAASPAPNGNHYHRAVSPAPNGYQQGYSRATSPMPGAGGNNSYTRAVSPAPPRGYNDYHRAVSPAPPMAHDPYSRSISPAPPHQYQNYSRGPSPAPYAPNGNQYQRAASPNPYAPGPEYQRAASPNPYTDDPRYQRAVSPNPYANDDPFYTPHSTNPPQRAYQPYSRAASPAPPLAYEDSYRAPSPAPAAHYQRRQSSPPPPPPPHRVMHMVQTPTRTHSPRPSSPAATGLTPSPLRNAMEDVMSSLEDMGLSRETESPEAPLNPWSPEAFDETFSKAARKQQSRPATSMDTFAPPRQSEYEPEEPQSAPVAEPAQLNNYVQRMESSLNVSTRHSRLSDESSLNSSAGVGGPAHPSNPSKFASLGRPKSSMADRIKQFQERPKSSLAGEYSVSQQQRKQQQLRHNKSSYDVQVHEIDVSVQQAPKLRHRKSAFEVGKQMLGRTFTTKSSSTTASSTVQSTTTNGSVSTTMTDKSLMSGHSAGGFSATSAGSLARKRDMLGMRAKSALGMRNDDDYFMAGNQFGSSSRPQTPLTGVTFHSSHASDIPPRPQTQMGHRDDATASVLGGFRTPKPKKSGFFKKIIESAKTSAASTRKTLASGEASRPKSRNGPRPDGINAIEGGTGIIHGQTPSRDSGNGGSCVDWVQVRRDVNRSNSLSRIERLERKERCQMMDYPAISPVDELYDATEGDESGNGTVVREPANFQTTSLSLVDKNSRFITNLPPTTTPSSLATGHICRPYRSDVQRLRGIFTWVAEKIAWEEDFDSDEHINARRVISNMRGCPEEIAVLVMEMCSAVGIHCEVIRGYLKAPGEALELGVMPRSNHWWNAVLVDNEWRIMDCSLAAPTHPKRKLYSRTGPSLAESWYFLARPVEICYTHIPERHQHQHLCPPVAKEILLALPCACPPFFKNKVQMQDFNTSLLRLEDLEVAHIRINVPEDIECVAEVEVRDFTRDMDGDLFESGEIVKKRALAQAEWVNGVKRYTIKALLPGDEGSGTLKIYAGRRGLMHSIKDIPHPLALALPIIHSGDNPKYDFIVRHPTPHAQRHDLYVAQPQCQRLAVNNTFVFAVRQHPSSTSTSPAIGSEPFPARPDSAMSMTASSASGSNPSTFALKKPAKLAIQSPGGKILRLMRKENAAGIGNGGVGESDGGVWETIIKCGERGVWRGLVLADRTARWCVFAEWVCV